MEERVKETLEQLRPFLQDHGGDVEFVGIDEGGIVKVRLVGACGGCPHAMITLKNGVERVLKDAVPEVTEVVSVE
jgi:Fe-S cluster biogenesis protein NfuA